MEEAALARGRQILPPGVVDRGTARLSHAGEAPLVAAHLLVAVSSILVAGTQEDAAPTTTTTPILVASTTTTAAGCQALQPTLMRADVRYASRKTTRLQNVGTGSVKTSCQISALLQQQHPRTVWTPTGTLIPVPQIM